MTANALVREIPKTPNRRNLSQLGTQKQEGCKAAYKKLTLRLSKEEYLHLKKQANAAGLKMEPMIRKLIMGMEVKPKLPEAYAELLRALSAIGNNVNQIAYWANARKSISQAECQRAILLIDEAWKLFREKL